MPPLRQLAAIGLIGLAACTVQSQELPEASPVAQHTVVVDGHPIAVWEKSPTSGSRGTFLLVHGRTWSSLPDFDLQVPGEDLSLMDGLVAEGFSVYAVDLRGYGETPRDETGWNTPSKAVGDVVAVLGWLEERTGDTPHLFGWSYGSMVSHLLVQDHPDLVSTVTLFGYPVPPGMEFPEEEGDPGAPPMEATTAEAAASDFITPGSISQAAIDEYVRHSLEADPVRADWTDLHEWNDLDPSQVTAPTLILFGEFDPLTPIENQVASFEGLGTSDKALVSIEGGDHAAFLETPRAAFIHALVGFITQPRR